MVGHSTLYPPHIVVRYYCVGKPRRRQLDTRLVRDTSTSGYGARSLVEQGNAPDRQSSSAAFPDRSYEVHTSTALAEHWKSARQAFQKKYVT